MRGEFITSLSHNTRFEREKFPLTRYGYAADQTGNIVLSHPTMEDHSPQYQLCLPSPLGDLLLTASETALLSVQFDAGLPLHLPSNHLLEAASEQLTAYFAQQLRVFDLPLAPQGTEFQQRVWNELLQIPYAARISYSGLSKRMHHPLAIRAIAAANGRNPIPVIIPCHRVVGSKGELVGFSGGLWRKKFLLDLEGNSLF